MSFAGVPAHDASPRGMPAVPIPRGPAESRSAPDLPISEQSRRCAGPVQVHSDVAAFALGVLDAEDVTRFAGHLEYCPRCQGELDDWLDVHARLADADADHFLVAEQVYQQGDLLDRLIAASSRRRSRLTLARLVSLGGSAVLFVAVVVASFGTGLGQFW